MAACQSRQPMPASASVAAELPCWRQLTKKWSRPCVRFHHGWFMRSSWNMLLRWSSPSSPGPAAPQAERGYGDRTGKWWVAGRAVGRQADRLAGSSCMHDTKAVTRLPRKRLPTSCLPHAAQPNASLPPRHPQGGSSLLAHLHTRILPSIPASPGPAPPHPTPLHPTHLSTCSSGQEHRKDWPPKGRQSSQNSVGIAGGTAGGRSRAGLNGAGLCLATQGCPWLRSNKSTCAEPKLPQPPFPSRTSALPRPCPC